MIMTTAFTLVNITMILLVLFAILKAAFVVINLDVGKVVKMVYKQI